MARSRLGSWTRRQFGLAASGVAASLFGLLGRSGNGASAKGHHHHHHRHHHDDKPKGHPDIILINVDDMRQSDYLALPKTQRLLRDHGATYPNSFLTTPLCGPSRSSLLRGQYVHNHGVLRNGGANGGWQAFHDTGDDESTLATWLSQAEPGYRTALVGKYLNGFKTETGQVAPGWSDWFVPVPVAYFNYTLNANGDAEAHGHDDEDYLTDVLAEKARGIIASTPKNTPLFLYFTPKAPHGPSIPAPRHVGAFANHALDQSGSFNEQDMDDKPSYMQRPLLDAADIDALTERDRERRESLLSVDEAVAGLVDALETAGRLERAYIFFVTDNGFLLGQHRRSGKQVPYEDAIRMSMLVRGPGVRGGRLHDAVVANIDLAPTIAALAGAKAPRFVDGRSFVETLAGGKGERQALLIEFFAGPDTDEEEADRLLAREIGVPAYRAIRTKDWLYVEYDNAQHERELYDLDADPFELQSRHDDPDAADAVQRLSAWLATLDDCRGARCRAAENSPPGKASLATPG
jgi:arylsulfatase A-like enzyme